MGFISGALKVAAGIFVAGVLVTECTHQAVNKTLTPEPDKTSETIKNVPSPQSNPAPQDDPDKYRKAGEKTGELLKKGFEHAKEFVEGAASTLPSDSKTVPSGTSGQQILSPMCISTQEVTCP